ncbi:hypothetical protein LIU39_09800 [Streptomyces sp. SF28]|nr:hypothetical protein [Streptomyces pinistramenti]
MPTRIAHEHAAAWGQQVHRRPQHLRQIRRARELLHDRVEDHRVEVADGRPGEVICRAAVQLDPAGERGVGGHLPPQQVNGL